MSYVLTLAGLDVLARLEHRLDQVCLQVGEILETDREADQVRVLLWVGADAPLHERLHTTERGRRLPSSVHARMHTIYVR